MRLNTWFKFKPGARFKVNNAIAAKTLEAAGFIVEEVEGGSEWKISVPVVIREQTERRKFFEARGVRFEE